MGAQRSAPAPLRPIDLAKKHQKRQQKESVSIYSCSHPLFAHYEHVPNLNVVYFFSPIPGKERAAAYDYFRQLSLSHRSFVGPGTKFFLYSTIDINEFGISLPSYFQLIVMTEALDGEPHFNRVQSWLDYVKSEYFDSNTLFLDADIVSRGKAHRRMFDSVQAALALSAAPSDKTSSWINAGLIWLNFSCRPQLQVSFTAMARLAERLRMSIDPRFPDKPSGVWGLDELVLSDWAAQELTAANLPTPPRLQFDEVLAVSENCTLLGRAFNLDPRSFGADCRALKTTFVHFVGHQKDDMFARYEPMVVDIARAVREALSLVLRMDLVAANKHLLDIEQVHSEHHLIQVLLIVLAYKQGDSHELKSRLSLVRETSYGEAERRVVKTLCRDMGCEELHLQIYQSQKS
jgi:hypothetical protein